MIFIFFSLIFSFNFATPQGFDFEAVKLECHHESLCQGEWKIYGPCKISALVGYENGTGQIISEIVISPINNESYFLPKVVRKSLVEDWNGQNLANIEIRPAQKGPIEIHVNGFNGKGRVKFLGEVKTNSPITYVNLKNMDCKLN